MLTLKIKIYQADREKKNVDYYYKRKKIVTFI